MGEATDALLEMQARLASEGDADAAADAGMEKALHAERIAEWKLRAERWLDDQLEGSLFTADDLVAAIGKPDVGQAGRNNAVGAWINAVQKRRRIEFTGRVSKSSRVEGHGNMQRLWRVKDGRVGGDAGCTSPQPRAGVSSSSLLASAAVGDQAASSSAGEHGELERAAEDLPDAPPGGPSDMASPAVVAVSEEEEWEGLRTLDEFPVPASDADGFAEPTGEQLGLLGSAGPAPGAYSRELAA